MRRITFFIISKVNNRFYRKWTGSRFTTVLGGVKSPIRFHFNANEFSDVVFDTGNKSWIFNDRSAGAYWAKKSP